MSFIYIICDPHSTLGSYRLRDSLGQLSTKALQSDHLAPALRPWPQVFILKEGRLPHTFTEGMNEIHVRKG